MIQAYQQTMMRTELERLREENAKLKAQIAGETQYWLCCGGIDPQVHRHGCIEAKRGHPEHCRFGTRKEHEQWSKTL